MQRTVDNKTLFADWSDVKTTPPVGRVERYWVEYRDFGKDDSSNSAVLDFKYSYLVVSPVQDAQNYEVGVTCFNIALSLCLVVVKLFQAPVLQYQVTC